MTVLVCSIWYATSATVQFFSSPPKTVTEIRWTSMHSPIDRTSDDAPTFPIELQCDSPAGCGIAVRYSGLTSLSRHCHASMASLASSCKTLSNGERLSTRICYSDQPDDGIYGLFAPNGSIKVISVSEAPLMEYVCP